MDRTSINLLISSTVCIGESCHGPCTTRRRCVVRDACLRPVCRHLFRPVDGSSTTARLPPERSETLKCFGNKTLCSQTYLQSVKSNTTFCQILRFGVLSYTTIIIRHVTSTHSYVTL